MNNVRMATAYLVVHVVVMIGLVVFVRSTWPAPLSGSELSHVQAGLIAAVWHLPLTAFVYRFAGRDLPGMFGLRR